MELGTILAKLRNQSGLTQRELASLLDVSNGAIAMWETNKRQPDIEMLKKLAIHYNVSTDYLLGNDTSKIIAKNEFCSTPKIKKLIDTFVQLNEDNQDIIIGEAKKALRDQKYEETIIKSKEAAQ